MPQWPKHYLVSILDHTVKKGVTIIPDITAADGKSLQMSLLRIRRRADKAPFILPEHYLVTALSWEFTHRGGDGTPLGRLVVVYDQMPANNPLPPLLSPDGRAAPTSSAPTVEAPEKSIAEIVEELRRKALNKGDND